MYMKVISQYAPIYNKKEIIIDNEQINNKL